MRSVSLLALLTVAAVAVGAAAPPPLPTKPELNLEVAMRVIDAAKAEATHRNAPCVIAIVDDGGWLIALQRMDHSPMLASVELAPGKARAAAVFRKSSGLLEHAIDTGRTAQVTAPGFVQMQGGEPLIVDGQVVGAIGVSSATPADDQQIADAGVKALTQ
jgi:glc operon protein GlcG